MSIAGSHSRREWYWRAVACCPGPRGFAPPLLVLALSVLALLAPGFTVAAVAAPEISISSAVSGAVSDEGTESQGSRRVGSQVTTLYTVSNTGTTALTLSTANVTPLTNVTIDSVGAPASAIVPPGGSTTFEIAYTPTAAGFFTFDVSLPNDDGNENPFDFTAMGLGLVDPLWTKEFAPTTMAAGGVAELIFVLRASDSIPQAYENVTFTDNLPVGMVVADPANATTSPTCGTPTLIANPGSTQVSFAFGRFNRFNPCTVRLDVTAAAAGAYVNTSSAMSSTNGGLGFTADPVSATLTVTGGPPEIEVEGNGVGIVDGAAAIQAADHTQLVAIAVDGGSTTRTFTIRNAGAGPLTLGANAVTLTGAGPGFSVSDQPDAIVPPGGTTTFTIALSATAGQGLYDQIVRIANDDADENPFTFRIGGWAFDDPIFLAQFADTSIMVGDTVGLAFFINSSVLGGASFTNTLPAGLVVANPANVSPSAGCGSPAITAVPGTSIISFDSNSMVTGTNCSITVHVSATAPGSYVNTSGALTSTGAGLGEGASFTSDPASASLTVTDAPPEIDVLGNGVSIPDGETTAGFADDTQFPATAVNGGSATRTFTIRNTGLGPLTLGADAVTVVDLSGSYTVSDQPDDVVPAGGSTTFSVTFDAAAQGGFFGVVEIANDDPNEDPYNFRLWAVAVGDPSWSKSFSPATIAAGDTSQLTIEIEDPDFAEYADIAFVDDLPAGLVIADPANASFSGSCGAPSLTANPGGSQISFSGGSNLTAGDCIISVDVTAAAPGSYVNTTSALTMSGAGVGAGVSLSADPVSATLTVTAAAEPEIEVTGNGVIIADGDVTPRGADHTEFPFIAADGGSSTRTFTIRNTGSGPLTLGAFSVSLSGAGAAAFSVTDQPDDVVAPGGSTSFTILFDAPVPGLFVADVEIANDDADESPFRYRIDGLGSPDPTWSKTFLPASVLAGDVARLRFSLETDDLARIENAAFVDDLPAGMVIADPANVTLSGFCTVSTLTAVPGGTRITLADGVFGDQNPCIIEVDVTAAAPGSYVNTTSALTSGYGNASFVSDPVTATLTVTAGPEPEIAVSGNGADIADGDATPAAADHTDFGVAALAGGTVVRTFTIANTGTDLLTLGPDAATLAGADAADFAVTVQPAATLAPGATTTVEVTFTPSAPGLRTATLSIANDDADEAAFDFAIQGAGAGAPEIAVSGNGADIADGDATPAAADHTDFGVAALAGGTVVRTFTIANTGTDLLTLGPDAATLAGADAADFAITAQPAATLAPGATTTVEVTFKPSAPGVRTATLSIANDDADEAPFDFAIAGQGLGGGQITVVQTIKGPDTTVGFSSRTGPLNFALTTASGRAERTVSSLSAGVHVITAADLTGAGYGIASIVCDDADSAGDVSARAASIRLSQGESVTCTFETIETRSVTSQMIADYLGARNTMILNHQPDIERRLDRLSGGEPGDETASISMFGLSGRLPSPIDIRMSDRLLSYGASTRAMASFLDTRSDQGVSIPDLGRWDIWSEGHFSIFDDRVSQSGRFGIIHVGMDYLATPEMLLGFKAQVDWMDQSFAASSGEVSGVGWMAGPYGSFRLGDNLYLDLGAMWGRSRNDISPFGTYTDQFETSRWLVNGTLVGQFAIDAFTVAPKVHVSYISEEQEAYVDALGVPIPGQAVSQGQVEFAPRLSFDHEFDNGASVTPWAEVGGTYAFGKAGRFTRDSFAQKSLGLSASVKAGLGWRAPGGARIDLSGQYDGIGSDTEIYGGRLGVTVPLN